MPYFRIFRGRKWLLVMPIQRGRQCPDCFAVVHETAQRGHTLWHAELQEALNAVGDRGLSGFLADEPGVVPRHDVGLAAEPEGPEGALGGGDYVAAVPQEVGGYIIGKGPLPAEMTGGAD